MTVCPRVANCCGAAIGCCIFQEFDATPCAVPGPVDEYAAPADAAPGLAEYDGVVVDEAAARRRGTSSRRQVRSCN